VGTNSTLASANPALTEIAQTPECRGIGRQADGRPVIAIVDDDPGVRKSLTRLLSTLGYRTEAFGSAEEFLLAAPIAKRACIVVDINLGETSGLDLLRQLSARGIIFPVIFISGVDDEIIQRQASELGCIAFLHKPFPADQLVKAVKQATGYDPMESQLLQPLVP
jgi:FixJ family two-component response regulator